jgi:hypothetical protein
MSDASALVNAPFNEFALVFTLFCVMRAKKHQKIKEKKPNNSSIVCFKMQFAYTQTDKEKRRNF